MSRLTAVIPLLSLSLAAACGGEDVPPGAPDAAPVPTDPGRRVGVFGTPIDQLDVLFVIDNSGNMRTAQASLAANFSAFVDALEQFEGGLPDLHIGVVSSNMGTAPYPTISGCGEGDDGQLHSAPRVTDCSPPDGAYIADARRPDGSRDRNYDGTLAETFACIAQLGEEGCGFEQHLASMKAALDGSNPINTGFLREDAALMIVILADEDDCSVSNPQMFDISQDSLSDPLGPLSSYRCFEFGVECEVGNPDPRVVGARSDCHAREDSPYMPHTAEFVDFLRSLKPDPSQILVAAVIGSPDPVVVSVNPFDKRELALSPSCQSGIVSATPGVRFASFLEGFPARSTMATICNENLADAVARAGELTGLLAGRWCLVGALPSSMPDQLVSSCTVSDVLDLDQPSEQAIELPSCTTNGGATPCYRFEVDAQCSLNAGGISLEVDRGTTPVPPGNVTVVECE